MSGVVVCKTHEQQYGVLSCKHVWEAVHAKTGAPAVYSRVNVDFAGDGTGNLTFLVCAACTQSFGIDPEKILSAEDAEKPGKFPETGPICSECLAEYEKVDTAD